MAKSKPWLNYHKPGAPVREYHAPKKKPKELFWARFCLITFGHMGGHCFYLNQSKKGVFWLVGATIYWLFGSGLAAIAIEDFDNISGAIIVILLWVCVVALEYRRLPKLVRTANEEIFGRRVQHEEHLQGGIGPFGVMRPVMFLIGGSYLSILLLGNRWPDHLLLKILPFVLLFSVFAAVMQYSKIKEKYRKDLQNDRS